MGIFGDLLSLPVQIVNLPLKVVDKCLDTEVSEPLDEVADEIKSLDDDQ